MHCISLIAERRNFAIVLLAFTPICFTVEEGHAESEKDRVAPVSFRDAVMPSLRKNCIACHNSTKEEGGVNLESIDAILAGDYDGLVVASAPEDSRLYVVAAHDDEPVMPPANNNVAAERLTVDELADLRLWIEQGAKADVVSKPATRETLQPISSGISTSYATAITPDGRLAAAGVGNRIAMFDSTSPVPIASLKIVNPDGVVSPPHVDFVQALEFADDGRLVISAGYQNVKFWRAASPVAVSILAVTPGPLAITLSRDGSTLAMLEGAGAVRVAVLGETSWTSTIDLPNWSNSDGDSVRMAVLDDGSRIAVAAERTLYLCDASTSRVSEVDLASDATAIAWAAADTLYVGDRDGTVRVWEERDAEWTPRVVQTGKQSVERILTATAKSPATQQPNENEIAAVIVDKAGQVDVIRLKPSEAASSHTLPAVPEHVAWDQRAEKLWITSNSGQLATLSLSDGDFNVVAKNNPASEHQLQSVKWKIQVADRLVRAAEADVAAAKATTKGEADNLAAIDKEIASKTKAEDEQKKLLAAAQQTADDAMKELAAADAALAEHREQREALDASVKAAAAALTELAAVDAASESSVNAKRLTEATAQKAAAEKALKEFGNENSFTAKVTAAKKKLDPARKAFDEAKAAYAGVTAGLELANASKERSTEYLKVLAARVSAEEEQAKKAKADRLALDEKQSSLREAFSTSSAANSGIGFLNRSQAIISRPSSMGPWNLWSPSGEWLFALPSVVDGELVSVADQTALVRSTKGEFQAVKFAEELWELEQTIGAGDEDLPFPGRVLCLDVDPTGQLLATGSGAPTRNGTIDLWSTVDGHHVRRLEPGHRDTVQALAFAPDGQTLATAGADRLIHIWDVQTGALLKTLEGHTDYVTSVAWDVAGRQLASGCSDGSIRVWDVTKGKSIRTITDPASEVTGLAYVGSAERLAATTGQRLFNVYTPTSGRRLSTATLPGDYVFSLSAARDGTAFLVGDQSRKLALVDAAGKVIITLEKP